MLAVALAALAPAQSTTQPTTTRPAIAEIPDATAAALVRQKASRFLELSRSAELGAAMSGQNPMTIFAPTDEAFEKLPAPVVEALAQGDRRVIRRLLAGHLAWGRSEYTRIGPSAAVRTLAGNVQFMTKQGSDWSFAGAHVIFGDQPSAGQTVIHFIDRVLLPPRWDVVDVKEILTDSLIVISGPTGGLLHAPTCPLGGGAAVAPATTAPAPVKDAPKWEKPRPPSGPRGGGWESVTVVEPSFVPGDPPKPPTSGPVDLTLVAPSVPSTNGAAAHCTCGLLPTDG